MYLILVSEIEECNHALCGKDEYTQSDSNFVIDVLERVEQLLVVVFCCGFNEQQQSFVVSLA